MLERGSCFSYVMAPSDYIRSVGSADTATEPDWLFEKRVTAPRVHADIKQVREPHPRRTGVAHASSIVVCVLHR